MRRLGKHSPRTSAGEQGYIRFIAVLGALIHAAQEAAGIGTDPARNGTP
jgi:hypothetical protein